MASLDAPRRNKALDISHDYVFFSTQVTRVLFQVEFGRKEGGTSLFDSIEFLIAIPISFFDSIEFGGQAGRHPAQNQVPGDWITKLKCRHSIFRNSENFQGLVVLLFKTTCKIKNVK
jgi:hypothetical protein